MSNVFTKTLKNLNATIEINKRICENTKNEGKYQIKTKTMLLKKQRENLQNLSKEHKTKKLKNKEILIQSLTSQKYIESEQKLKNQEKSIRKENETLTYIKLKKCKAKIKNQKENLHNQAVIIKKQIEKLIKQEKIIRDLKNKNLDNMIKNKSKLQNERKNLYSLNEMIKKKNTKLKTLQMIMKKEKQKLKKQEKIIHDLKNYNLEKNKTKIQNQDIVIQRQNKKLNIQEHIIDDLKNHRIKNETKIIWETKIFKNQILIIDKQKRIIQDLTNETAKQFNIYEMKIQNLIKQSKFTYKEKYEAKIQNQKAMLHSLFGITKKQKTQLKIQEKKMNNLKNQNAACESSIQNQTKELKHLRVKVKENVKKTIANGKDYLIYKIQKEKLKIQDKIIHDLQNQKEKFSNQFQEENLNQVKKNLKKKIKKKKENLNGLNVLVKKQKKKLKNQKKIIDNQKNQKAYKSKIPNQLQEKDLKLPELRVVKKNLKKKRFQINTTLCVE